jgi:hypothetical protein
MYYNDDNLCIGKDLKGSLYNVIKTPFWHLPGGNETKRKAIPVNRPWKSIRL